jgi:hypothetical protein
MDESEKITILSNGLYSAASNLSSFILGSCTFLLTIMLIKVFAKERKTFKILDVEIPLSNSWLVIAAYTIGHFYFSYVLVQRIDNLKIENIQKEKSEIWTQLTYGEKSGTLFSNMESRTKVNTKEFLGIKFYTMQNSDITTWVSFIIAISLFFTVFNFRNKTTRQKIYSAYFSLFFCVVNWTIGSWWAVKISFFAP